MRGFELPRRSMKVAILSGSVYGTAEDVARHAERQLKAAGFDARHDPAPSCSRFSTLRPMRCWS